MTTAPTSSSDTSLLAHERTSQFLEGGKKLRRQIITPEGVPVPIEIANYGERLTAFVIDLTIWILLTLAIYIPLGSLIGRTGGSLIAISVALFIGFLIRNLYFIYFELAWRGATPGKRIVGLRVIDRSGGPLVASAVIARNLTREVEMFIPLGILLRSGNVADWHELLIVAWVMFCLAIPALNRDRMRGGDLIAGTIVISLPKVTLLSDLVERALQFSFTPAQLQAYGAFELQVLEELLRRPQSRESTQVLEEACTKICHKIGWTEPVPRGRVTVFLSDFYTAERAFLEREQLYGKARADKYSGPAKS